MTVRVHPFVRVEHMWGTAISLHVHQPVDPAHADDVFAFFSRVDDLFSTWRDDSEISCIARGELSIENADPAVAEVLALCDSVRLDSDGAFDVSVASDPRVAPRQGFGPRDPSGLVKGWALGVAADRLRARGVTNFVMNAGGDVVTSGHPFNGDRWCVGVQHPRRRDAVAFVLAVTDVVVATSGRYERGDHIVDPRSGRPATDVASVTVVHHDGAIADGYATAALVLGEHGAAWLADRNIAGAVITNDDRLVTTPSLEGYRV